jgi:hypothetical protein
MSIGENAELSKKIEKQESNRSCFYSRQTAVDY